MESCFTIKYIFQASWFYCEKLLDICKENITICYLNNKLSKFSHFVDLILLVGLS